MALRTDTAAERLVSAANAPSGDFTATFWWYPVADIGDFAFVWGLGGDTGTNASGYALWQNGPDIDDLELWGPPGAEILSTGTLSYGAWYFIAARGNTGASQAWQVTVNANETGGTSPAGGGYVDGPVDLMGSPEYDPSTMDGRLTAYKHWSVQLSDDEVQNERWTYLPQRWANLWTCAPLIHTSALGDVSGQGHGFSANGTLSVEDGPPIAWSNRASWAWETVVQGKGMPVFQRRWQAVPRRVWVP